MSSCVIKRSLNRTFVHLYLFNLNYNINYQFKYYMFSRSYKVFRVLFDQEVARLSFTLSKFFYTGNVYFFLHFVRWQKPNFKTVALTANPVILGTYFIRKYTKMYAFKRILKAFRGMYESLTFATFNLKGLRVQINGPLGAPRNRKSRRITKFFFGTTPLQTFCSLIAYSVKSKALSDGVVTAKFWLYKKFPYSELLSKGVLLNLYNTMVVHRRRRQKAIFQHGKRVTKLGQLSPWNVYRAKAYKLFKPHLSDPKKPICFYYHIPERKVIAYLRSRELFNAMIEQQNKDRYYDVVKFVRKFNKRYPKHQVPVHEQAAKPNWVKSKFQRKS